MEKALPSEASESDRGVIVDGTEHCAQDAHVCLSTFVIPHTHERSRQLKIIE